MIGAELLTRFLDYTDRSTCILFGDGAGAVVLSASDERGGPVGIEMTTEPQGAYMIWLPAGGSKSPPSAETDRARRALDPHGGQGDLSVRDATLASTALAAVAKAGLEQDEVDLFIPHQANVRIIEAVAKGLDLPMDKIYVNLDRYGNTSAASVPIALAEAVNEGRVAGRRQDRVRRVRGGLHVRRRGDGVDRRPGPWRDAATRSVRPRTSRSGCPSTGTRSTRSRRPSPRSSPGRSPRLDLSDVVPGDPERSTAPSVARRRRAHRAPGPCRPGGRGRMIDLSGKSPCCDGRLARHRQGRSPSARRQGALTSASATAERRAPPPRPPVGFEALRRRQSLGSRPMPQGEPASPPRRWSKQRSRRSARSILVNNAGITRDDLIMRMKPEDWTRRARDEPVRGVLRHQGGHAPDAQGPERTHHQHHQRVRARRARWGRPTTSSAKAGLIGLPRPPLASARAASPSTRWRPGSSRLS